MFKKEEEEEFFKLVKQLVLAGYTVNIENCTDYLCATNVGGNIQFNFCTPYNECYPDTSGKIAADHRDCFDKWSRCPLVLPFPKNEAQIKFLLHQLELWATKKGYTLSNKYHTETWVKKYPEET